MAQIGCYMSAAEAEQLTVYAAQLELTRPALCALIIQRELRAPTLRSRKFEVGEVPVVRERRVTVNIKNPALKIAFTTHVAALGFGSDEAAELLFRQELAEKLIWQLFGSERNRL